MNYISRYQAILGLFFILFLIPETAVQAQDDTDVYLRIYGTVVNSDNNENIPQCLVKVFKNDEFLEEYETKGVGKYEFFLPTGHSYRFYYIKDGFVSKNIEIDCVDAAAMDDQFIFSLKADISLFQAIDGIDYSVMEKPIGIGFCNGKKGKVQFDKNYTKTMESQIASLYVPVEANTSTSNRVTIEETITEVPDEDDEITVEQIFVEAENMQLAYEEVEEPAIIEIVPDEVPKEMVIESETEMVEETKVELVEETKAMDDSIEVEITEPVTETVEIVEEEIAEPITEKAVEVVEEGIAEPVTENVVEVVEEEITEPVTEKAIEVVEEEITEPVAEKAVEVVEEEITEPVTENVIEIVEEAVEPSIENANQYVWRVQIGAYSNEIIDNYAGLSNIDLVEGNDGITRIVAGYFDTPIEAAAHKVKLINKGFSDAFLTAFKGNTLIPIKETGVDLNNISYTKLREQIDE